MGKQTRFKERKRAVQRARRRKRIAITLSSLFVVLFAVAAVVFFNRWIVTVTLAGQDTITIEAGQPYTDDGAEAAYKGSTLLFMRGDLKTASNGEVDTSKPGEYVIP